MSGIGLKLLFLRAAKRADEEAGEAAALVRWTKRRRILRERRKNADAFDLKDEVFIKTYRLSKTQVRRLVKELEPLMPKEKRPQGLDAASKILITLAFYASGSYQSMVGRIAEHAVSQPSVSRAIHDVTEALNDPSFFKKHIYFPHKRVDREKIKRRFYTKYGIPGVVGCIDGTHISIIKPSVHEEAYFCRKGYHSLNVMIICDADMNILCVDPSAPGSTHDSTVWRDHPLNQHLMTLVMNKDGEINFLLGDSGYPLRKNLMTPILNTEEGTPEHNYYTTHVSARNVVERTIGVLKARFRCLLGARQLYYKPEMAAKMVNACCVLHNFVNRSRLDVPELTAGEQERERRQQLRLRHEEAALAAAATAAVPARRRHNPPLEQGRKICGKINNYKNIFQTFIISSWLNFNHGDQSH